MSKRNGDKARANREQKKKVLRRIRNRDLQKTLENKTTVTKSAEPK